MRREDGGRGADDFGWRSPGCSRVVRDRQTAAAAEASIGWPDTNDAFLIGAEFHRIDPDSEARIEIVSSDEITTVSHMQLYAIPQENSECVRWVEGESTAVGGIGSLGTAPFQSTLLFRSGAEDYELSWEWPQDVDPHGRVTRTLRPSPPVDANVP